MNPLYVAAAEIQELCQSRGWRFSLIGGLVLIRWSDPRQTRDVDLSLLTGFGNEKTYIDALLKTFSPRVTNAAEFAANARVLLLSASNGVPIDVSFAALPFEERVIERSSVYEFYPGYRFPTISAEDLVIMKAFAGRGQDWADVENILLRQGPRLDRRLIFAELEPLCLLKEDDSAVERLRNLMDAQSS
jgi:hypothetical protein